MFVNRQEAGRALASALADYANDPEAIVLALPRGGVPVAFEISRSLRLPLEIFLVRKLGVPEHEELAMGAIATGGTCVLNEEIIERLGISKPQLEETIQRETVELERREAAFRPGRNPPELRSRTCLLVDDGLATGSTMHAAVRALKKQNPRRIVVAVPVGATDTYAALAQVVDEVVCLFTPEPFVAVGRWYQDFSQLTDDEVRRYLEKAGREIAH